MKLSGWNNFPIGPLFIESSAPIMCLNNKY